MYYLGVPIRKNNDDYHDGDDNVIEGIVPTRETKENKDGHDDSVDNGTDGSSDDERSGCSLHIPTQNVRRVLSLAVGVVLRR